MDLCFATNNQGKLAELKAIIGEKFNILSLQDLGCTEDLPETQPTIPGNSKQKAEYIWNKYKVSCFADDTGLEVYALDGAPGVYSARYAGPKCDANDNMALLIKNMENFSDRRARFICCITLILDGEVNQFEGIVEGEILKEKQGQKGFGYDPIFKPMGYDKTFAELEMGVKNKISHRGRAVQKLVQFLNTQS